MVKLIKGLDDTVTDSATKEMLYSVVSRKEKYDNYRKKHIITMSCMFVCVLSYLFYLYFEIIIPYSYSMGDFFHGLVNDGISGIVLIVIFALYATMDYFYKKREKAEKEFHLLRCEIVDKSKDLWKSEKAWKQRGEVFSLMKEKYDINLYHENK